MKKLFTFILLFVVLGLISGCEEVTPEKTIDNAIKQISISEVVEGDVGRVVLPNNKKDVYFEWSSSDEEVITKNGYVTHDLLYDKEVTLTVKATYQGISKIKDFPIIVKNTSADQIIDDLLDEIYPKKGRLLLNVGPDENGNIPEYQRKVLADLQNYKT